MSELRRYQSTEAEIAENIRLNQMQKERDQKAREVPENKPVRRVSIPRDSEIESIKRTLYNAIDKLDKIQRREAELTTT